MFFSRILLSVEVWSFADRAEGLRAPIREAPFLESANRDRTQATWLVPRPGWLGGITVAGQRRNRTGFAAEQSGASLRRRDCRVYPATDYRWSG
jgi:hypothetical protein